MENIQIIKDAVKRKHPCDPVHKAISETEVSMVDLVMAWNELPDELRFDERLNMIGEIVKEIGGV